MRFNPVYLHGRYEHLEDVPPNPPEIIEKAKLFLRNSCMKDFTLEQLLYLINKHVIRMQEGWSQM